MSAYFFSFSNFQWTGVYKFFHYLEHGEIYTWPKVCYSLFGPNATNICPTVKFLLQRGIQTLQYSPSKIFETICYYLSTKKVILCVGVTIGIYFLLRRLKHWKFGKKYRKIALLSKGSDQSRENINLKGIERHIMSRLQQELSHINIQLVEKSWERGLDDGQQPVIVYCVISSRIGTDIENAMRGVHGNSPVVLVLLHCALRALLERSDLSDHEELLDPTMKNRMTGIVHFAFSDREGLYSCFQNKNGFQKLLNDVTSLP